jgi:hypothetical protein
MQGIAHAHHAAVPAANKRSASSCQIQNHSLISQGKKDNQLILKKETLLPDRTIAMVAKEIKDRYIVFFISMKGVEHDSKNHIYRCFDSTLHNQRCSSG